MTQLGKDPLQQELIQLLQQNLHALTNPSESPEHEQEPLPNYLERDLELLDEPSAGARDLIAAARWMMTRLPLEERCLLVGLCERMGGFAAGIAKAEALLKVAGTVEEAAWAMEHQDQLVCEQRALEDLDRAVNVDAILFLIDLDLELGLGLRQGYASESKAVREQLKAVQKEGTADGR
ncbi:MAG: hypothetical protein HC794_03525 [Nitrospiraceae bacterium]|nr:hypothetical protein [Nitrospiraceae bacterium]